MFLEWAPWAGFIALIIGLLALDLLVFHRKAHAVSLREAAGWSVFWVALGLGFGAVLWGFQGGNAAGEYFAGYLLEKSLSVDNVFVFVLIFSYFSVPPAYQHRVLFWGVLGALILRAIFIVAGAALLAAFHWVLYLFGAFLLYTGFKMFRHQDLDIDPAENRVLRWLRRIIPLTTNYHGQRLFTREAGLFVATPLFAVLVLIETTDLIFAVDSIPAIFAVTRDPFIVFTSNVFAILGLRALYFLLAGVAHRFVYLKVGLAAILMLVGVKMLLTDVYHVPVWTSLAAIAAILVVAIGLSLRSKRQCPTPSTSSQGATSRESRATRWSQTGRRDPIPVDGHTGAGQNGAKLRSMVGTVMKAARLVDGELQIQELPTPELRPEAALIRMTSAGVCHSDLHIVRGDWAGIPTNMPLGHEGIGIVEALGPGADRYISVGDRVILGLGGSGGGYWCGACEYCMRGEPRHCAQTRGIMGTFSQEFSVWAKSLVPLPDSIPDEEVPLACGGLTAYGAVKKLLKYQILPGRPVAIIGAAGGLGHYAVQIASAFGYKVVGVDIGEDRLKFIQSLGAHQVLSADEAAEGAQAFGGVDASLVFSAKLAGFKLGLDMLKKGGLWVGVGIPASSEGNLELNPWEFFQKDPRLVYSAVGNVQDMREVVDMAAAGQVKTHVGRTAALSEVGEVFDDLEAGRYVGRGVLTDMTR